MTRIVALTIVLALALGSCSLPRVGGIVQGVVYADLDGSGTIEEPAEGPLEGVEVTLADCGPLQTQVTAADGAFQFTNLPEGTCHVSVSKAGWIFSGSYPSISYPMPAASDPDLPTAFSMFMAPVMDFIPDETATPVDAAPLDDTETPTTVPTPTIPMVTPLELDVNCRFGPGLAFLAVGGLVVGNTVPILATINDRSWWQIENPNAVGTRCWVSAAATRTLGDVSLVPVIVAPTALVTKVTVTTPPVVHGFCQGPNPTSFEVSITTNGPTTVTYHLEIYNGDGTLRNKTTDETRTFASASTQTFDPGGAYKTDCGEFYIKVMVTSPNAISAQANWEVVEP